MLFLAASRSQSLGFADSPQSAFDAVRLKTGIFIYHNLDRGTDIGTAELRIEPLADSGNYRFSAHISGKFSQQWESVATRNFEPVSAKLTFGEGPDSKTSFELHYASGKVTGFRFPRATPATKLPVDALVPAGTVDQRIDWAAVLASDFDNVREFEFRVYDPGIGISRAFATVGPVEHVQVRAGSFDARTITYRIDKSTAPETYQILATTGPKHIMLRETFQNGVVGELAALPATSPSQ